MKKLRTNSKEVKKAVQNYIIESVYDENENTFESINEAAKHLHDDFKRVANHPYNLKRLPKHAERFTDYLRGIPFYFATYDNEIKDFLNSLGINPENKEYSSDKMWSLYGLLIYREIENY